VIEITVPGFKKLKLIHLVLDYNGTMACKGKIIKGVKHKLEMLADKINIHILTADTFGNVMTELSGSSYRISILSAKNQDIAKGEYIDKVGKDNTVCIGNGRNDRQMIQKAALGIAVAQEEGTAVETIMVSDVIVPDILSALNLLSEPRRLIATLRS
jgi:soluble P-type ATPase